MSNAYYSPNVKLTGGALFLSMNSKEGHIYAKFLRQIAFNPKQAGNFDGKNPIHVKLSQDEAGGLIRAVRTKEKVSFFHKFDNNSTTINFGYYSIPIAPNSPPNTKPKEGFGLTVKKNNVEIKIGFTLDSAERLSEYLKFALTHIFNADYRADQLKFKESQKTKETSGEPTTANTPRGDRPPDEDF